MADGKLQGPPRLCPETNGFCGLAQSDKQKIQATGTVPTLEHAHLRKILSLVVSRSLIYHYNIICIAVLPPPHGFHLGALEKMADMNTGKGWRGGNQGGSRGCCDDDTLGGRRPERPAQENTRENSSGCSPPSGLLLSISGGYVRFPK